MSCCKNKWKLVNWISLWKTFEPSLSLIIASRQQRHFRYYNDTIKTHLSYDVDSTHEQLVQVTVYH